MSPSDAICGELFASRRWLLSEFFCGLFCICGELFASSFSQWLLSEFFCGLCSCTCTCTGNAALVADGSSSAPCPLLALGLTSRIWSQFSLATLQLNYLRSEQSQGRWLFQVETTELPASSSECCAVCKFGLGQRKALPLCRQAGRPCGSGLTSFQLCIKMGWPYTRKQHGSEPQA